MPTLQIHSDLHLEFLTPFSQQRFFESLDPTGVDVLVLAGDICVHKDPRGGMGLREVFRRFCDIYPQVVYVLGNHEYYRSSPEAVHGEMWDICVENKNLTWLDSSSAEVAGIKFAGGTLWFPEPSGTILGVGRQRLSDYHQIKDFEPWVYDQNTLCRAYLKQAARHADVVVTHHMPSPEFIAPRYQYQEWSHLNWFFYTDLSRLMEDTTAALWVFGHTHDRMWERVGDTVVLCNAKGYPHEPEPHERGGQVERGAWVERCLVEVQETQVELDGGQVRGVTARVQGKGPGPGMPGTRNPPGVSDG